MAGGADHVLLTRFNLPSKGFEGMITAKEGWLTDRIALFEFYCLPSAEVCGHRLGARGTAGCTLMKIPIVPAPGCSCCRYGSPVAKPGSS